MATNRSRRLRKKLCVDEFQEAGFEVQINYPENADDTAVAEFFAEFIVDVIEANEMAFIGGEDYGIVCLARRGSVTEEQRNLVEQWLKGRAEVASVEVGPLVDAWYPDTPLAQA
ncbi:YggL family protein [Thiopseudomonas alkaliphila]|uniref:YggL 50S ribosome-binding family protein n=1 Tax=Thiopseudomonas alkaliphila TaxID=1697053 RepID=UPI0025782717|nr:50S ribosome-binding protein YggL [Thiopseudomonas alkaliphila]MDM1707102.1 DUF469 family protein [Thiopseudomonas alkaliphila]